MLIGRQDHGIIELAELWLDLHNCLAFISNKEEKMRKCELQYLDTFEARKKAETRRGQTAQKAKV